MKNQALPVFSWKDKSKKLECRLLQFLFGALRVKKVFGENFKIITVHSPFIIICNFVAPTSGLSIEK